MAAFMGNFGSLLLWAMLVAHPIQNKEIKEIKAESWKKGSGGVQEQTLKLSFDASKRHYQTKIKDNNGKVKYDLIVDCTLADKHSPLLSGCSVRFVQRRFWLEPFLDADERANLLRTSNDPYQDYFPWEDMAGDFFVYPESESFLSSTRRVKVKNFFVTLKAVDYQEEEKAWLKSLTIELTFKNSTGQ
jgi:hypothetical protein